MVILNFGVVIPFFAVVSLNFAVVPTLSRLARMWTCFDQKMNINTRGKKVWISLMINPLANCLETNNRFPGIALQHSFCCSTLDAFQFPLPTDVAWQDVVDEVASTYASSTYCTYLSTCVMMEHDNIRVIVLKG